MKQTLLFLVLIICFGEIQGQGKAKKQFNQGLKQFKDKNYSLADSLFKLSLTEEPSAEKFKTLAMLYKEKGDLCASCRYLNKAIFLNDKNAFELYRKQCQKIDTIRYNNQSDKGYKYLSVMTHDTCEKQSRQLFIKRKSVTEMDYAFYISDTNKLRPTKMTEFPDVDINLQYLLFIKPQILPTFPGGEEARIDFLVKNIIYPEKSKWRGSSGDVFVTFIVNNDGTLSDISILRSVDVEIDNESLRVVRLMPKWEPGKVNGKAVRTKFNLPIRFTIQ
ncbi:MAG: energy transducer TonB [Bacteroidales bacterium]|nr:energy transducer TonB [Bacteroidales bacterium]